MKTETIQLGPWQGVNNVEDELSAVYQVGGERPAHVREAVNVDLTKDGWFSRRVGHTKLLTLTDAHSLASVGGRLLLVDNGTLKQVSYGGSASTTVAELTSGLSNSQMWYALAGGQIFCCNGADRGRITSASGWTFWGLDCPSVPTLSSTTGGLPAGTYQVALTAEALDGTEGGSRQASQIVLSSAGGITASITNSDSNAAYTNVYFTNPNGQGLFWAARVPAATTSINLVSLPQSTDMLDRMQMYPPPEGASMVEIFKGRLLVVAGTALYWSQPQAYHLFKRATDVQLFAEAPRMIAPSIDGFYVGEGDRTWWVGGDDPDTWSPIIVDTNRVSYGPVLKLPGHKIPALQTPYMVSLWANSQGLVAGLPSGQLRHLTEDSVAMDANTKATLAYREKEGLAQILMNLRQADATSGFAASDRMTAEVIRANVDSK